MITTASVARTATSATLPPLSASERFAGRSSGCHVDTPRTAQEVINRKNARFDRLAEVGSLFVLTCILASVVVLGIWLVSTLLVSFAQFDLAETINVIAGSQIMGH